VCSKDTTARPLPVDRVLGRIARTAFPRWWGLAAPCTYMAVQCGWATASQAGWRWLVSTLRASPAVSPSTSPAFSDGVPSPAFSALQGVCAGLPRRRPGSARLPPLACSGWLPGCVASGWLRPSATASGRRAPPSASSSWRRAPRLLLQVDCVLLLLRRHVGCWPTCLFIHRLFFWWRRPSLYTARARARAQPRPPPPPEAARPAALMSRAAHAVESKAVVRPGLLSLEAKQRSARPPPPPTNQPTKHGPASRRPRPSAESAPLSQPLYCLSMRPTSPPYPGAPQLLSPPSPPPSPGPLHWRVTSNWPPPPCVSAAQRDSAPPHPPARRPVVGICEAYTFSNKSQ
jgi:hypothetical protein